MLLPGVRVKEGKYRSLIKLGTGEIGGTEGNPSEVDATEVNHTGQTGERGIGAAEVDPLLLPGVWIKEGKYRSLIKLGCGKIGIDKGNAGKIDRSKVDRTCHSA